MKVLILGSGGREHCLSWAISKSRLIDKIYIAPGNGGTSLLGQNVDIKADDIDSLLTFAKKEKIDLTVVGPENPLVGGIVDVFQKEGLKIFGPNKELAQLEGSKVFAKRMMEKYGLPTAPFEVFDNASEAKKYIRNKKSPQVVKANGLAAGKGVVVCKSEEEALSAIDLIMVDKEFGSSGNEVVIEDCLEGEEASILVFTDGKKILPLVSSQDHKRIFDGDQGPNTGGMGAYAPAPLVDKKLLDKIISQVFEPLIFGLRKEQKVFRGILYAGLMIKDNNPYVLEFNVRFGDPETQAILPKLKTDLVEVINKTIEAKLDTVRLEWDSRFCVCVVLASGGYPGDYQKGKVIEGLDNLSGLKDVFVFHAGTKQVASSQTCLPTGQAGLSAGRVTSFTTSGGRVLNVVGLGNTLRQAQDKAYKAISRISFQGMQYRKDVGNKALGILV